MSDFKAPLVALDARARTILFTIIAEYVTTGEAVSSQTLVAKHEIEVSSATLRREMQRLTELGLLIQPHTSAGRIPTDRAFRLFADALKEEVDQLSSEKRRRLQKALSGAAPRGPQLWQAVARVLSELSAQTALVATPPLNESILRQLRFVPVTPHSLIAVLVTREGLVHNVAVESPSPIAERELESIHNYLGSLIEGRTLNEVRRLLRQELEDSRARCDSLRERASLLGARAIEAGVGSTHELVVDGRTHLYTQPELRDRMEEVLGALEEKTRILQLLDQAAEIGGRPAVLIGSEGGKGFEGCAVVSAPFGRHGSAGQIGIIGSTRMDYSSIIPIVALSAQFLSSLLEADD